MFDIADVPFALVPEDEKKRYANDIKQTGSYRGYKMRQYWVRLEDTDMGNALTENCMSHDST